jgi:hypothetical protein
MKAGYANNHVLVTKVFAVKSAKLFCTQEVVNEISISLFCRAGIKVQTDFSAFAYFIAAIGRALGKNILLCLQDIHSQSVKWLLGHPGQILIGCGLNVPGSNSGFGVVVKPDFFQHGCLGDLSPAAVR